MTDFLLRYDENIKSLLHKKENFSGTKSIDQNKSANWVKSQKTVLKRRVAQFFIDNTVYVSFSDFFGGIGELIKKNYEAVTNDGNRIVIVVGREDKSQYMVAVIALYFIRLYKFREPDEYIDAIERNGSTIDNIIIFDDMSYSGSQMGDYFQNIYKTKYPQVVTDEVEAAKSLPKIKCFLYGVNSNSLNKLTTVNVIKAVEINSTGIKKNQIVSIDSPFKVYYLKKFRTFREIDHEMCDLVNYFYAPYLYGHPFLSIYFDHKIADDVSTYMKVLSFGPIIPKSYSILSYLSNNDKYLESFPESRLPTITTNRNSGLSQKEIKAILPSLAAKYGDSDPLDASDVTTDFSPFLSNCSYSDHVCKRLRNIPYLEFLYPENPTEMNVEHDLVWDFVHDNNVKCLKPFYKKPLTEEQLARKRDEKNKRILRLGGKSRKYSQKRKISKRSRTRKSSGRKIKYRRQI